MGKKKTDVIWFRFKYSADVKTRAAVIRAADRMFRQIPGVIERRDYTEEEVAACMKKAIEIAAAQKKCCGNCRNSEHYDYEVFCKKNAGKYIGPEYAEDNLGTDCEDFEREEDEDKSSTAEVGSAPLADRETEER